MEAPPGAGSGGQGQAEQAEIGDPGEIWSGEDRGQVVDFYWDGLDVICSWPFVGDAVPSVVSEPF